MTTTDTCAVRNREKVSGVAADGHSRCAYRNRELNWIITVRRQQNCSRG